MEFSESIVDEMIVKQETIDAPEYESTENVVVESVPTDEQVHRLEKHALEVEEQQREMVSLIRLQSRFEIFCDPFK